MSATGTAKKRGSTNKNDFWSVVGFIALAVAGVFIGAAMLEKLGNPCPVCGTPLKRGTTPCPNCKTPLRWENG